jgi:hypothetical protein
MVLVPAAEAGVARTADSAIAGKVDAKVERSRRGSRNIDLSWLETGQRPMIHYAGAAIFAAQRHGSVVDLRLAPSVPCVNRVPARRFGAGVWDGFPLTNDRSTMRASR